MVSTVYTSGAYRPAKDTVDLVFVCGAQPPSPYPWLLFSCTSFSIFFVILNLESWSSVLRPILDSLHPKYLLSSFKNYLCSKFFFFFLFYIPKRLAGLPVTSMRPLGLGAASPQVLLRPAEFCGSHGCCPYQAAQE